MALSDSDRRAIHEMLTDLCEGRLDESQHEQLWQWLEEPEVQDLLVGHTMLDADLRAAHEHPDEIVLPPPAASLGPAVDSEPALPSPGIVFPDGLPKADEGPGVSAFSNFVLAGVTAIGLILSIAVVLLVTGLLSRPVQKDGAELARPEAGGNREVAAGTPRDETAPSIPHPSPVATLTRLCDARWAGPQLALAEMGRLTPGQDVKLDAGRAEINFDAGVRMVVEGPAHVRILDRLQVQAYSGAVAARVGKEARGFSVVTPQGKVVDLGTEFGLRIDAAGREEVAVFDGTVDVDYRAAGAAGQAVRRLLQGEGCSVAAGGQMSRLVAITDGTFPRQVQPSPARRPVIAAVSDNFRRPDCKKFYEIVRGGLQHRTNAYVDSFWKWGLPKGGIPAALVGADYVRTFGEDVNRRDIEIVVQLAQAADLYVLVDDRTIKYNYRKPPAWLDRFERTDWKIVLDEGFPEHPPDNPGYTYPGKSFSIFRLHVPGPQTVKLGGNGPYSDAELERHKDTWNADMAMYGIAAVARPEKAPHEKNPQEAGKR